MKQQICRLAVDDDDVYSIERDDNFLMVDGGSDARCAKPSFVQGLEIKPAGAKLRDAQAARRW